MARALLAPPAPAGYKSAMPKNTKQPSPKQPPLDQPALAARMRAAGFTPQPGELAALHAYLELLQKWNKVMNLVGPYNWAEMLDELILDSFHLAAFIRRLPLPPAPQVWDLGAGAGLPGIPLRILWQAGSYAMVDSREKRGLFLQNALSTLKLPGTQAVTARAEDFMQKKAPANLIVSRAFMPWQKVLELVEGHLAPGGLALFMALEAAPAQLPGGWRLAAAEAYSIPPGTRHFWAVSRL